MATSRKSVSYAFPALASMANDTLTGLTQITISLPETGPKTFRSVVATITMDDIVTATGGSLTTKRFDLRLGAAAFTSVLNSNGLTHSGKNLSPWFVVDYTAHFAANWTGASMTCDFQAQVKQSTGTTLGMVNVCVTLDIDYEYDDTSTTHVKTVLIPLNAPTGALATAPTTYDTIPALDTYLPEASKVYRSIHLVLTGNTQHNFATTSHTLTLRVGAASVTTGAYEGALTADRLVRYVWDLTSSYPSTAVTQTWQPTASIARMNHPIAWLVVTYEFDPAATTEVLNSVMLPGSLGDLRGGTVEADSQRLSVELWIQEPGPITTQRVAFALFLTNAVPLANPRLRIGASPFTLYTDGVNVSAGSNAMMVRDDAVVLARGRNVLTLDMYKTTQAASEGAGGVWLINYRSGKSAKGVAAHNRSVIAQLGVNGTGPAAGSQNFAAASMTLPDVTFFASAVGVVALSLVSSGATESSFTMLLERVVAEGGPSWFEAIVDAATRDALAGASQWHADLTHEFARYTGDATPNKMALATARRSSVHTTWASIWAGAALHATYHAITYTVGGSVTGSSGGTVTLNLCRVATGERVLSTTRVGNGPFAFTWFDNTEEMFVEARESGVLIGRSDNGLATGSP